MYVQMCEIMCNPVKLSVSAVERRELMLYAFHWLNLMSILNSDLIAGFDYINVLSSDQ